jgi:glycosyltransferase involved in cell wall biosynthesis
MHISVIVPSYNHERYVARCLASIDAQSADLEVIVVDDGSTDATWKLVTGHTWRRSHSVQLLRTENRGAHAALNQGLQLATGDYIALCNSDDAFDDDRLDRMLASMHRWHARFAFSGVRFIDEADGDVGSTWDYARDLVAKQQRIQDFPTVGFALVLTNVAISTGNFLFHRSIVQEIGHFRPYRYCHDWDFILRALLCTEPLFVESPLYSYRLHEKNSFRALADAAGTECPELMRRFMKATVKGRYPNRLAPSPRNWPGFFEHFIEEHHYEPYLAGWEDADSVFFVEQASSDSARRLEAAG